MWKIASDKQLASYFEGANIWRTRWKNLSEVVSVPSHDGRVVELQIWSAEIGQRDKLFAASEVSNGVWVFALLPL
ncbi:hypothetical protein EA797_21640 [Stutzerimonas zhaodongensis]|uniref:Uncharacterized protein n=2 Tax=Stutzerimonas zhaodongensis TaxID=1176257 RepID=A0A3M2HCE7_9GAMM|nr:hypothetical protein EA797_21640 [Stutzerimonas zhaodongensis]